MNDLDENCGVMVRPGGAGSKTVRVCFVLAYRAPDYIRGRSLCAALEGMHGVELSLAINHSKDFRRYWESIQNLIRIKRSSDPDIYILGFRGHEMAWLVYFLTRGKPFVFDAMMSPYAAMVEEGKIGIAGRLLAPVWKVYEKMLLRRASAVLTDTALHARYYTETFGIPERNLVILPVGAIEHGGTSQASAPNAPAKTFKILFYGSFLPLHGLDVILDAAVLLNDLPLEFRFIGGNATQARLLQNACAKRGIRNYVHARWVPMDRLITKEIPCADLCLGGPFGGTRQARRVVTGKSSQCLALGKATVIGRIDEDYGFIDKVNCLLVDQGDAESLATAIRWAHTNRAQLPALGASGKALYGQRLSVRRITMQLAPLIQRLAA